MMHSGAIRIMHALVFTLVILLTATGCDEDCVCPEDDFGAIVINPSPDHLDAPWTLYGSESYSESGSGDQTLNGLLPGEYMLRWGDVSGWITPIAEVQTLSANGALTFSGIYVEPGTGAIVINPSPDHINATWTLGGPGGYSENGSGDQTLNGLLPGEYTVTWNAMGGYFTPSSSLHTLGADETITFSATYAEVPGPINGFIQIPAGTFEMGSPTNELGHNRDETQHTVTLTTPLEIFETEVTNAQYAALAQWALDHNPPLVTATGSSLQDALDGSTRELLDLDSSSCEISFNGSVFIVDEDKEDHPVKNVSWYGAVAYCDWLSLQSGLPRAYDHGTWECNNHDPYNAQSYRLPTEAEWEYACRAGTSTAFASGPITTPECEIDPNLDLMGWYCGNAGGLTHRVAEKIPNAWGFYDMHGNVSEWCNDWYDSNIGVDVTDPTGDATGGNRVYRGGYSVVYARGCRSAERTGVTPTQGGSQNGFRPVKSASRL